MYGRKAYGPHRRRSQQALAGDIAASILAARQHGEHRPMMLYTQDEDTIWLVEEQLAAAARESQLAQEGEHSPMTEIEHQLANRGGLAALVGARLGVAALVDARCGI